MAEAEEKAADQLREITECPICMSEFSDPRILPCIHTFCFECLKRTSEAVYKNPGDKMPCPLCRKDFVIPEDGVSGVQKNFFMENLLTFKATTEIESAAIICDMCNVRNDGKIGHISKASMRCLECQDNYCERCVKVHQFQKVTKHHQMVKIESDIKPETTGLVSMKSCPKHIHKLLDCYCADCKKIVCVSCVAESHASHKCKDVTTVEEEFRQTIERKASKISTYKNEMLSMRNNNDKRIADFLKEIADKEKEIHKRNKELKDMMDRHTKSLLDELLVIKSRHLKEMEIGMDEIDRHCTILGSFEAYCTELRLRGSASDICSSFDELILRSDELERDHEAFSSCPPHKSIEVSFQSTDLSDVLQNADSNLVGKVEGRFKIYDVATPLMEMDGQILVGKPLHGAVTQRKDERNDDLNDQYLKRISEWRMPAPLGQMYSQNPSYYMGGVQQFYPPGIQRLRPPNPRWQHLQMRPAGLQLSGGACMIAGIPGAQRMSGSTSKGQQQQVRPAPMARPITGTPAPVVQQYAMMQAAMKSPTSPLTNVRAQAMPYKLRAPAQSVSGQAIVPMSPSRVAVRVGDHSPLTASLPAEATPEEQKQMLGERLYLRIHNMYPNLAGKITGMLLETDNSKLLHMLENRESLKALVEHAISVLQAHQAKEAAKKDDDQMLLNDSN